jgi:hypothetical protein
MVSYPMTSGCSIDDSLRLVQARDRAAAAYFPPPMDHES